MRYYQMTVSIPDILTQELTDRIQEGGWRIAQEQTNNDKMIIIKLFIGMDSDHAILLSEQDLGWIINLTPEFMKQRLWSWRCQLYWVRPTEYQYQLVPPVGRIRTYKYEMSARSQKRWIGGRLYRRKITRNDWEEIE